MAVTLAKYIHDNLTQGGWAGVTLDEEKQSVKIPSGDILTLKRGEYQLNFYWYSVNDKTYSQREKYGTITFPKDYNIRNWLYFRNNGNYKFSREQQFKNIINPLGKEVKKIKISSTSKKMVFVKGTLSLPQSIFDKVMADAEHVYQKSQSYRSSTENYLSNIKSHDYSKNTRKR